MGGQTDRALVLGPTDTLLPAPAAAPAPHTMADAERGESRPCGRPLRNAHSVSGGSSAKKAKVSADAAEPVLRFSDTGRVGEMLPLFYQKLFPASEMVRCAQAASLGRAAPGLLPLPAT